MTLSRTGHDGKIPQHARPKATLASDVAAGRGGAGRCGAGRGRNKAQQSQLDMRMGKHDRERRTALLLASTQGHANGNHREIAEQRCRTLKEGPPAEHKELLHLKSPSSITVYSDRH